jgi:hypothetical protein
MSRLAITVEDIRKVQLKKTPSTVRVSITSYKLVADMLNCKHFIQSVLELNGDKLNKGIKVHNISDVGMYLH